MPIPEMENELDEQGNQVFEEDGTTPKMKQKTDENGQIVYQTVPETWQYFWEKNVVNVQVIQPVISNLCMRMQEVQGSANYNAQATAKAIISATQVDISII